MANRETFRTNLNRLIEKEGITQVELAKGIGVPYPTVSGWTRGISYPRIETLEKVATFFNVTIADLIAEDGGEREIVCLYRMLPENAKEIAVGCVRDIFTKYGTCDTIKK